VENLNIGHSLRFLADRARNRDIDEKKRKSREIELENAATERLKSLKIDEAGKKNWLVNYKLSALQKWEAEMEKGTDQLYKQLHGENWKEARENDLNKLAVQQEQTFKKQNENRDFQKKRAEAKEVKITGFKWI
jgi:chromatin structure-remodeling complex subunit RSC1/2